MRDSHKKIIDAIIHKANSVCPKSLALIAVYGSVANGDEYSKSDLDLLILINDNEGWQLGSAFILDDEQVGYDIYCTTWNGLEEDAKCNHARLNKLLDSNIVYISNEEVRCRYEIIKQDAIKTLQSEKRFESVENIKSNLYQVYAKAMIADDIGEVRAFSAEAVNLSLDVVMIWNGKYFKRGIKRTFDELEGLSLPDNYIQNIMMVVKTEKESELKQKLTILVRSVSDFTKMVKERQLPSKDNVVGTYEEMYSNWKNKMYEAAERKDSFASFVNMASLYFMMKDISEEVQFDFNNVLVKYDSDDLAKNAANYDNALEEYLKVYRNAGIEPRHFSNVNEFINDYNK